MLVFLHDNLEKRLPLISPIKHKDYFLLQESKNFFFFLINRIEELYTEIDVTLL